MRFFKLILMNVTQFERFLTFKTIKLENFRKIFSSDRRESKKRSGRYEYFDFEHAMKIRRKNNEFSHASSVESKRPIDN